MAGREHYDTLGVPREADADAIKAAYRRLAIRWHPDKNPNDVAAAEVMFKKIASAYEVLRDPQKRSAYDKIGEEQSRMLATAKLRKRTSNHILVVNLTGLASPMDERSKSWSDSLKEFWLRRRRVTKAAPVEYPLHCSLEDLYNGSTKGIKLLKERVVASGYIKENLQRTCIAELITISIERGWKAGNRVIFEARGNEYPDMIPADVIFIIVEKPHEVYKRDGDDLVTAIQISPFSAIAGYQIQLTTLDGRTFQRFAHPILYVCQELVVPGEGMPKRHDEGFGDLRIRFNFSLPQVMLWVGISLLFGMSALMLVIKSFTARGLERWLHGVAFCIFACGALRRILVSRL